MIDVTVGTVISVMSNSACEHACASVSRVPGSWVAPISLPRSGRQWVLIGGHICVGRVSSDKNKIGMDICRDVCVWGGGE